MVEFAPARECLRDHDQRDGAAAVVVGAIADASRVSWAQRAEAVEDVLDLHRLFRRFGALGAVGAHEADDGVVGAEGIVLDELADADVVVVGCKGDVLAPELGVGTGEDPDHVPCGVGSRVLPYRRSRCDVRAGATRGQRAEWGT